MKGGFLNFPKFADFSKRKSTYWGKKSRFYCSMLHGNMLSLLSFFLVLSDHVNFSPLSFTEHYGQCQKDCQQNKRANPKLSPTHSLTGKSIMHWSTKKRSLKKENSTIRKTAMMKNVMRMSQILTRIECLIGKKENLIKNLNTYTKNIHRLSPNLLNLRQINSRSLNLQKSFSDFITTNITVKSQKLWFFLQINVF